MRKHEKLLNVPAQLLLTADVALQHSAYGGLLERCGVPAWSVLATFLAETRRQPEGDKNEWGQYVDALPSQTGCVLEWASEEATSRSCLHAHMWLTDAEGSPDTEACVLMCRWTCCGGPQL